MHLSKIFPALYSFVFYICFGIASAFATTSGNQTDALSPVLPESGLPFHIMIEKTNFQLPVGFHSGVVGVYNGLWVLMAGRINGLHGFGTDPFPPDAQNTNIYVINPDDGTVKFRALNDPSSGLNQKQIDTLSVTSPQFYQEGHTLYMTGGYGIDTGTGTFDTKPVLTAIDLAGIVRWVEGQSQVQNAVAKSIRQIYHPIFQVTGGHMFKIGRLTQLDFGQNFSGVYNDNSNGEYTKQVRRFRIINTRLGISVSIKPSFPHDPDPDFRRRDLNIVPIIQNSRGRSRYALMAYAGVFTTQTGVWTVPVLINANGNATMADPNLPTTFKQAMNHYICANAGLYSQKQKNMYNIFFGGITYGFFSNGTFQTDSEIPFTNEVTTVKIDKGGNFTQYLMNNQYPVILSTQSNPGNPLLFGASARFITNPKIQQYTNGVIRLDRIRKPTVIGHIVGGIQSTLPNTNVKSDSAASPFIFKVTLIPNG